MLNYLRKIISPNNPIRLFWHKCKAITANIIYCFPSRNFVCIGITGTNGKTTTTHLVEHVLRNSGKKVAMLSTSNFAINGKFSKNKSKKTTLSPFKTQKFLKRCLKNKIEYIVIESSSHALHQNRLWGINFAISGITNITHEHLDYHKTMKAYADAKKFLFKNTAKYKKSINKNITHIPCMILNKNDNFFNEFNSIKFKNKISYGYKDADLMAHDIQYSKLASKFAISYNQKTVSTNLKIPGSFNVENALLASGIALACKIDLSDIAKYLSSFAGVEGRMEFIKSNKGFEVLVDFALTPDALEKLYQNLHKSLKNKNYRIVAIIGSCGDRDKEKRPIMGRLVAKQSTITIVTDEEPYSEDPKLIMEDVLSGAKQVKTLDKDLFLIEDRYNAIEFAIKNAKKGDIIVLTGMGNLPTRTLNSGPIEWNESQVVKDIISKYS